MGEEGYEGPIVTVEAGTRGGWGQGLDEQMSFQLDPETAGIIRIMHANTRRTQGDILRDAIRGDGLCSVEGYKTARAQYLDGRRVAKATATGGKRPTAGAGRRSARSGVARRSA